MSQPDVEPVAQEVYDAVAPLAYADEENAWALLWLCATLAQPAEEIARYVRDRDDMPGWAVLLNVELTPEQALGYLGQFFGVRLPAGLDEDSKRTYIKDQPAQRRGSVGALRATAKRLLTGAQTVYVIEREDGSFWRLTVTTNDAETPDPAAVERALRAPDMKPVGYVLTYSTVTGVDFETLRDTHADFAEIEADFTDFADVRSDPAQT